MISQPKMTKLPPQFDSADEHLIRAAKAFAPVVSRYFRNSEPRFFVGSGFLVEVGDKWFWMTADHVLDGMEKLQDFKPDSVFEFLAPTDPTHGPIHFNYDRSAHVSITRSFRRAQEERRAQGNDSEHPLAHLIDGLDVGFIELSDYYRRHFLSFDAQPLTRDDLWNGSPEFFERLVKSEQVRFVVMGTPGSSLEIRDGQIKATALKVLDIWPNSILQPQMRFDAIWREGLHQGSVAGMSGGPAYAVVDDKFYWFGVQSKEYAVPGETPTSLIIALATTVLRLMLVVENALPKVLDDSADDEL